MAKSLLKIDHPHGGDSSTDEYCLELLQQAILQEIRMSGKVVQQSLRETVTWMAGTSSQKSRSMSPRQRRELCREAFARLLPDCCPYNACDLASFISQRAEYLRWSLNGVILDDTILHAALHQDRPRPSSDD